MAIKNYPNRIYSLVDPAIDRVMARRNPKSVSGRHDASATAMNVTISPDIKYDWQLDSIMITFSDATARDYAAIIQNGRKVVENYNDYLWVQITGTLPQQITLDADFYNGTQLAAELENKLDANSSFAAQGVTFTVAYSASTGKFTITPSSGQIRYLNINEAQTLRTRDSIAGHLFGLNATTSFGATVESDTEVYGLNKEASIINQTGATNTEHYHDTIHILTIDKALKLTSSKSNVVIDYTIEYEEIV